MIGIYKITSNSGKTYIGQSVNIEERFIKYKRNDCKLQPRLYNSIKKHGIENHNFEIIEECSVELLNERERYWQDYYQVIGINGLNCRLTKSNDKSGEMSIETKLKLSNSKKGFKHTEKSKELCSINNAKYWLNKKRGPRTLEEKNKIRNSNIGKKMTLEQNKKLSQALKKIILCNNTGIFYTYEEITNLYGIKRTTLAAMLNNQNPNKTSFVKV